MKDLLNRYVFILGITSIGLLSLSSCINQEGEPAKAPEGVISIEQAKILDRTFTRTRYEAINQAIGMQDNRSSWWSLEDLKMYLNYAEQEADKKGYKLTGIRIYQGAYPKDWEDKDVAGYGTVFLSPTGYTINEQKSTIMNFNILGDDGDIPIDPLNIGHAGDPPQASYPNDQ